MTTHLPIACTLSADELPARLAEIGAVSHDALRAKHQDGARAVLHFNPAPGIGERLATIVAAESRCCAFLTMNLTETPGTITLTIDAPTDAAPVLAELVASFELAGSATDNALASTGAGRRRGDAA